MATYKKPLKTIVIKTLGGTAVNAADTATNPIASDALRDFEAGGIIHVRKTDGETLIPFHAVDNIEVTASTADVEKVSPVCPAEEESDDNGTGNGD